jgi:hypothetical protein
MKVGIFIIKFLFLGALFILSNENLHLALAPERAQFYDLLYSWLERLFQHSMKIVGYVIDSEWLPKENLIAPLAT